MMHFASLSEDGTFIRILIFTIILSSSSDAERVVSLAVEHLKMKTFDDLK